MNYAFIDNQNLYKGVERLGWKLDYAKFRIYLKDKYGVSKAYLFIGYLPENQNLYSAMQEYGYLLIFKPVLRPPSGHKPKGNVDADSVLNIMKYYQEYDKAVLVTSDGDFDTTTKYLRKKGKLGVVLSPNKDRCSALLQIAAQDKIDYLDNLRTKLEYKRIPKREKAPQRDGTQRSAFS